MASVTAVYIYTPYFDNSLDDINLQIVEIYNTARSNYNAYETNTGFGRWVESWYWFHETDEWRRDTRGYQKAQNDCLTSILSIMVQNNCAVNYALSQSIQNFFGADAFAAALNTFPNARLVNLSYSFLNSLKIDVINKLSANFFNGLNLNLVSTLDASFFSTISATAWTNINISFFEALPQSAKNGNLYGPLNCLSNAKVAELSIVFLNSLSQATVDNMIDTLIMLPGWRSTNFSDAIPKSKWLALDSTKYGRLLARATLADANEIMTISSSSILLSSLNALSPAAIGGFSYDFLKSLTFSFASLSGTFINNISINVLQSFSADGPTKKTNFVSVRIIDNLDQAHVNLIYTAEFYNRTQQSFGSANYDALMRKHIARMSDTTLRNLGNFWNNVYLSSTVIGELTLAQVSLISIVPNLNFLNALNENVVSNLTINNNGFINRINPTVIASLNNKWATKFSTVQSVSANVSQVKIGGTVRFTLNTTRMMTVTVPPAGLFSQTSPPLLVLSNGANAVYVGGSGTNNLIFEYVVGSGAIDNTNLRIVNFSMGRSTIVDSQGLSFNFNQNGSAWINGGDLINLPNAITIDTSINVPVINTIATDNIVNATEKAAGVNVSGTAETNASVIVTWANITKTVTAPGGNWSTTFRSNEIPNDNPNSVVSVVAIDLAGNASITATRAILIDTAAPSVPTVNLIAADNIINAAEKSSGVAVNGTADANTLVVVTWGAINKTITANGTGNWSTTFASNEIPNDSQSSTINVVSRDTVGNISSPYTRSIVIDTIAPNSPTISATIATDNIINASEKAVGVNISGRAQTNASVIITWATTTKTVTAIGGNWSARFANSDIPADSANSTISVVARDSAGNISAPTTKNVVIDTTPNIVTIDTVATNDVVNAIAKSQGITVSGTAESGVSVALTWGTITKTVTANSTGRWNARFENDEIPEQTFDIFDLENILDQTQFTTTITAVASDIAGNTNSATRSVIVDTVAPNAPYFEPITVNAEVMRNGITVSGSSELNTSTLVTWGNITKTATILDNWAEAANLWSVTFTSSEIPSGGAINLISAVTVDIAGNISESVTNSVTVDTSVPTVVLSTDRSVYALRQTGIMTFTFSEAVTNFDPLSLTCPSNLFLYSGNFSASGLQYTASFLFNSAGAASNTVSLNAGAFQDSVGNANAATSLLIGLDVVVPTLINITANKSTFNTIGSNVLTFTFSEAVTGFTSGSITLSQGNIASVTGTGSVYTAVYTLRQAFSSVTVSVAASKFSDMVGNRNTAIKTKVMAVDIVSPSVSSITTNKSVLNSGSTAIITFITSEAVLGFTSGNINIAGGASLSGFSGAGSSYTAILTHNVGSTAPVSISINAAQFTDIAGNSNLASSVFSMGVDAIIPNAPTINIVATDDKVNAAERSSGVVVSGTAEAGAFVVVAWGSANKTVTVAGDGIWSSRFESADPIGGSDAVFALTRDAAGNQSIATRHNVVIDVVAPDLKPTLTMDNLWINQSELQNGVSIRINFDSTKVDVGDVVGVKIIDPAYPSRNYYWFVSALSEMDVNNGYYVLTPSTSEGCRWGAPPTGDILDGPRTIQAYVQDAAGNKSVFSDPLTVTIDTEAPNAPLRAWIPVAQGGITADEATQRVNFIVDLSGSNAVLGDRVYVSRTALDGAQNRTFATLNQTDINNGFVSFRVSTTEATYASNPNFNVYIVDQAGNQSANSSDVRLNFDGFPISWFDSLNMANFSLSFFEEMANTLGLLASLNVNFFNRLDTSIISNTDTSVTLLSDSFLNKIPSSVLASASLNASFLQSLTQRIINNLNSQPLTSAQVNGMSSNWIVFLNAWVTAGSSMPLSLLNLMSVNQVANLSNSMLLEFVAEVNQNKLGDDFIIGLAQKTFGDINVSLCISISWLQKLTEHQLNLFLNTGMQVLSAAQKNAVIPVAILNNLLPTQISNLHANIFSGFMPLGHLRNNELNQSVIDALTPLQISQLSLAAVAEIGTNIKNNTYAYIFTKAQIQALLGSDNLNIDTQLSKFFEGYYSYDPDTGGTFVNATIAYSVLNKLSRIQAKQMPFLLLDSCLPDLSTDLFTNVNFLIGLGDRSNSSNSLVLNDVNYHALKGEKLEIFLSGWGNHLITGQALEKLTISQIASLSKDVILKLDAAHLSAAQLNAIPTTIINNLDISWFGKISLTEIASLSLNFIRNLGAPRLAHLSNDWIKSISVDVLKQLDASWIAAIIQVKGVIATIFTAAQVAKFSANQLQALFSASVSYQTGDGAFQDISSVVGSLTKDQVIGVSFYLINGAVRDSVTKARLMEGRTNLNDAVLAQIEVYENNAELYEFSRENPIGFGLSHPLTNTNDLLNNVGAAIRETRRLLDIAPLDDWHLLTADTVNRLFTEVMKDYNYTDSLWAAGQSTTYSSVNVSVNAHFGNLNKSTIQNLSNFILQNIELSSFTSTTVHFLTDAQVLIFLARFHSGTSGRLLDLGELEKSILLPSTIGLLSPQQIINLPAAIFTDTSSNTWGVKINLDNINNYSAIFLSALGQREAEKNDHILSAAQVQSLGTGSKLSAFLTYWTSGVEARSLPSSLIRLFSTVQLSALPDIVYQNLANTAYDVLTIIPPSKIALLSESYFAMSLDKFLSFPPNLLNRLNWNVFIQLSNACLLNLSIEQWLALDLTKKELLLPSNGARGALQKPFFLMTMGEIALISLSLIQNLRGFESLMPWQLNSFTTDQIAVMTNDQISALSVVVLNSLSENKRGAFTPSQLLAINTSTVNQLDSKWINLINDKLSGNYVFSADINVLWQNALSYQDAKNIDGESNDGDGNFFDINVKSSLATIKPKDFILSVSDALENATQSFNGSYPKFNFSDSVDLSKQGAMSKFMLASQSLSAVDSFGYLSLANTTVLTGLASTVSQGVFQLASVIGTNAQWVVNMYDRYMDTHAVLSNFSYLPQVPTYLSSLVHHFVSIFSDQEDFLSFGALVDDGDVLVPSAPSIAVGQNDSGDFVYDESDSVNLVASQVISLSGNDGQDPRSPFFPVDPQQDNAVTYVLRLRVEFWRLLMVYFQRLRLIDIPGSRDVSLIGHNRAVLREHTMVLISDWVDEYTQRLDGYANFLITQINALLEGDVNRGPLLAQLTMVNAIIERDSFNINFYRLLPSFIPVYQDRAIRPLINVDVADIPVELDNAERLDNLVEQVQQRFSDLVAMIHYPDAVLQFQEQQALVRERFIAFLNQGVVGGAMPADAILQFDQAFGDAYFERTYYLAQVHAYETFLENVGESAGIVPAGSPLASLMEHQRQAINNFLAQQNTQGMYLDNRAEFILLLNDPAEYETQLPGAPINPDAHLAGESEFDRVRRRFWAELQRLTVEIRLLNVPNWYQFTPAQREVERVDLREQRDFIIRQYEYFFMDWVNAEDALDRENRRTLLGQEIDRITLFLNNPELDNFTQQMHDGAQTLPQTIFIPAVIQGYDAMPVVNRARNLEIVLSHDWQRIRHLLRFNRIFPGLQEQYEQYAQAYRDWIAPGGGVALDAMITNFSHEFVIYLYVDLQISQYLAYLDDVALRVATLRDDVGGREDIVTLLDTITARVAQQRVVLQNYRRAVTHDDLTVDAFADTSPAVVGTNVQNEINLIDSSLMNLFNQALAIQAQMQANVLQVSLLRMQGVLDTDAQMAEFFASNHTLEPQLGALREQIQAGLNTVVQNLQALQADTLTDDVITAHEDVLARRRMIEQEIVMVRGWTTDLVAFLNDQQIRVESSFFWRAIAAQFRITQNDIQSREQQIEAAQNKLNDLMREDESVEVAASIHRYKKSIKNLQKILHNLREQRNLILDSFRGRLNARLAEVTSFFDTLFGAASSTQARVFIQHLSASVESYFETFISWGNARIQEWFLQHGQTGAEASVGAGAGAGAGTSDGNRVLAEDTTFSLINYLGDLYTSQRDHQQLNTQLQKFTDSLLNDDDISHIDTTWIAQFAAERPYGALNLLSSPFAAIGYAYQGSRVQENIDALNLRASLSNQLFIVNQVSSHALSDYLNGVGAFTSVNKFVYAANTVIDSSQNAQALLALKQTYISQGQTTFANTVLTVLIDIANQRGVLSNGDFLAYQTQHLQDLYNLKGNYLLAVMSQYFKYLVSNSSANTAEVVKWKTIISASQVDTDAVSDVYVVSGQSVYTDAWYATSATNRKKYNFAVLRHITATSVVTEVDDNSQTNLDDEQGSDISVALSNIDQAALVVLSAASDFDGRLMLSTSGLQNSIRVRINTDKALIIGGNARNIYEVSADLMGTYEIWGGSSGQDSLIFDASTSVNKINLDNLHDVSIFSKALKNQIVGTNSNQRYITSGGIDHIAMSGDYSTAYVDGRGNTVNMTGLGSTVNVMLGQNIVATESLGNINGLLMESDVDALSANLLAVDFSSSLDALSIQVTASDVTGTAKIVDASANVIDGVNFTKFQRIHGSNLGDRIEVKDQTRLKELILGTGGNRSNAVLVEDTQGLSVFAGVGEHEIYVSGDTAKTKTDVFIETKDGTSQITVLGNAKISAILGGTQDTVDFSRDSSEHFSVLETRSGRHIINIGNNVGRKEIILNSLYQENETIINDTNTIGRTSANRLIISLATDLSHANVKVNGNELYIESTDTDGVVLHQKLHYTADFTNAHSQAIIKVFDEQKNSYVYVAASNLFAWASSRLSSLRVAFDNVDNLLLLAGDGDVSDFAIVKQVNNLALSVDSGFSNTDWITNQKSQTISGSLTSALAIGEHLQISVDDQAWIDVSVSGTAFSQVTTLQEGSHAIRMRIVDDLNRAQLIKNQRYILDTSVPNVNISYNHSLLSQTSSSLVTLVLSEPLSSFSVNNLSVQGGTLSEFSGSGVNYVVRFTPTANTTEIPFITMNEATLVDAAGNVGITNQIARLIADTSGVVRLAVNVSQKIYAAKGIKLYVDGVLAVDTQEIPTNGIVNFSFRLESGLSGRNLSVRVYDDAGHEVNVASDITFAWDQLSNISMEWLTSMNVLGLLPSLLNTFWNQLPDAMIEQLSAVMVNQITDFSGLSVHFLNTLAFGVANDIDASKVSQLSNATLIAQLNANWDEVFVKANTLTMYGMTSDQSLIEVTSGNVVRIELNISGIVNLEDAKNMPYLRLSNGEKAYYVSGTGTDVLVFGYVVGGNQNTDNLSVLGWGDSSQTFVNGNGNHIAVNLTSQLLSTAHVSVANTQAIKAISTLTIAQAANGINVAELAAGVNVQVFLTGTNAAVGDKIEILVDGESINNLDANNTIVHVTKILSQADITAGIVNLTIPKGTSSDEGMAGLGNAGHMVLSATITRGTQLLASGGNVGVYVDGVRPQLLAVESDYTGSFNLAKRSAIYTYVFDQVLPSLTLNDFTIENGVINSVSIVNNTCIVQVTANLNIDGKLRLTLLENKIGDDVGNNNLSNVVEQFVVTKPIASVGDRLSLVDTNTEITLAAKHAGVSVRFSLTGLGVHVQDKVEILLNENSWGNPIILSITQQDIDRGYVQTSVGENAGWGADGVKKLSARLTDFAGNVSDISTEVLLTMSAGDFGFAINKTLFAPALANTLTQEQLDAGIGVMVDLSGVDIHVGEHILLMVNGDINHAVSKVVTQTDLNNHFVMVTVDKASGLLSSANHMVARVVNSANVVGGFGGSLISTVPDTFNLLSKINLLSTTEFVNIDINFIYGISVNSLDDNFLTKLANRWLNKISEFVFSKVQFDHLNGAQILKFLQVLKQNDQGALLLGVFVNILNTSRLDVNLKSFLNNLSDLDKQYISQDVLDFISSNSSRRTGFLSNLIFRPFATTTNLLQTPQQLNEQVNRNLDEVDAYLSSIQFVSPEHVNAQVQIFVEYLNTLVNHDVYPMMLSADTIIRIVDVFQRGIAAMGNNSGFADLPVYLAHLLIRVPIQGDARARLFATLSRLPANWIGVVLRPMAPSLSTNDLVNLLSTRVADVSLDLPTDFLHMLSDVQLELLINRDGFNRIFSRLLERAPVGVILRYLIAGNALSDAALVRVASLGLPDLKLIIAQLDGLVGSGDVHRVDSWRIYLNIFHHLSPQMMSERTLRVDLLRRMGDLYRRINVDVLRLIPPMQIGAFLTENASLLLRIIGEEIRSRRGQGDFALVLTAEQWGALLPATIDGIFGLWLSVGEVIPVAILDRLPVFTLDIIRSAIRSGHAASLSRATIGRMLPVLITNSQALMSFDPELLMRAAFDVGNFTFVHFFVSQFGGLLTGMLNGLTPAERVELLMGFVNGYGYRLPDAIVASVRIDEVNLYPAALLRLMPDSWILRALESDSEIFDNLSVAVRLGLSMDDRISPLIDFPRTSQQLSGLTSSEISQIDFFTLNSLSNDVIGGLSRRFINSLLPSTVSLLSDNFVDAWLSAQMSTSTSLFAGFSDAWLTRLRWSIEGGNQINVRAALEYLGISVPNTGVDSRMPSYLRQIGIDFYGPQFLGEGVSVLVIDSGVSTIYRSSLVGGMQIVGTDRLDGSHGTMMISALSGPWDGPDGAGGVIPRATVFSGFTSGGTAEVGRLIRQGIDLGVDIISISMGAQHDSLDERSAVAAARAAGVLISAAAGNSGGGDEFVEYPARYARSGSGVFAVGATTLVDGQFRLADFTTIADSAIPYPYVTAPGVEVPVYDEFTSPYVLSPVMSSRYMGSLDDLAHYPDALFAGYRPTVSFPYPPATATGTSPATAIVSGALGLLIGAITRHFPAISRPVARLAASEALLRTAIPLRLSARFPAIADTTVAGGSVGVNADVLRQYMSAIAPRGEFDWSKYTSTSGSSNFFDPPEF